MFKVSQNIAKVLQLTAKKGGGEWRKGGTKGVGDGEGVAIRPIFPASFLTKFD